MITDLTCSSCGAQYRGNHNSHYCPACALISKRKSHRDYMSKQREAEQYAVSPAPPPEPPRRLRQLQRVTRWNVKTGRKEERWE